MIYETVEIDAQKVEIHIIDGIFQAEIDGQKINKPTLKLLKDYIKTYLRERVPVQIEASTFGGWHSDEDVVEDIVIVGKHAGNGNWLYREKGSTHTEQLRSSTSVAVRFTKEDRAELKRLVIEKRNAEKAVEKFKSSKMLNITRAFELARAQGIRP